MQDVREQRDEWIRVNYLGLALYIVLGGISYGVLFGVVQPYPLQCRDIWSPIFVYLAPCFSIVINIITLRDGEKPKQTPEKNCRVITRLDACLLLLLAMVVGCLTRPLLLHMRHQVAHSTS